MKNKIGFILPPIILAIVTVIWYFCRDGRWYGYRDEVLFAPLRLIHIALPLFYLIAMIVNIVSPKEKSPHKIFYIIASIVLMSGSFIGALVFLIMTSGL